MATAWTLTPWAIVNGVVEEWALLDPDGQEVGRLYRRDIAEEIVDALNAKRAATRETPRG